MDGSNLKNLNSVFENFENLKFANLTLQNGNSIESMDNSFNGWKNLIDVDLKNFKPKQNISIENMFQNCENLNYIDLSNFHSYNYGGIFTGCSNLDLNINIDINIDINQIINTLIISKTECEIGPGPKCKSCMEGPIYSRYCDEYNEGYYIPSQKRRINCLPCEDNCLQCSYWY